VRGTRGRQIWIAGLAFERDAYVPRDVQRFAYAFTVPGAFIQYDIEATRRFALSASGRVDVHSEYGTFSVPACRRSRGRDGGAAVCLREQDSSGRRLSPKKPKLRV